VTRRRVSGINTRYRPALHALHGLVTIREIYGATECIFDKQHDEKKASRMRPSYDLCFPRHWPPPWRSPRSIMGHVFEVQTWPEGVDYNAPSRTVIVNWHMANQL
jgi:hypothetical protein